MIHFQDINISTDLDQWLWADTTAPFTHAYLFLPLRSIAVIPTGWFLPLLFEFEPIFGGDFPTCDIHVLLLPLPIMKRTNQCSQRGISCELEARLAELGFDSKSHLSRLNTDLDWGHVLIFHVFIQIVRVAKAEKRVVQYLNIPKMRINRWMASLQSFPDSISKKLDKNENKRLTKGYIKNP